jgi:predicted dehydrogenase
MIRAGLVGLGKMGLSHLSILNAHPEVDVVAVCDSSQYVLDVLAKYTSIKTYSDYRRMIDESRLDCAVVATPSRFHAEMVRYALEHGLHVFCEKPFCLDLAEGEALIELATRSKLVNQVGYHFRFVEPFREAHRLLQAGVLGQIHHIRAEAYGPVVLRPSGSTWRSSRTEGGGCLYDYASHALDLIHLLIGAPNAVSGVVVSRIFSRDVDDEVYASLHFPDGATGQLAANWSDESHRKMSTKVTVWGTNGRLLADRQECQLYLRAPATGSVPLPQGWMTRYTTDLIEPVWFYLRGEEYSRQIDHFVQSVRGRTDQNLSTFSSALETDRVVNAMLAAAKTARTLVDTPSGSLDDVPARRGLFGRYSRERR